MMKPKTLIFLMLCLPSYLNASERDLPLSLQTGIGFAGKGATTIAPSVTLSWGYDIKDWIAVDGRLSWSYFLNAVLNEGPDLASEAASHRITTSIAARLTLPTIWIVKLAGFRPYIIAGLGFQNNQDSKATVLQRSNGSVSHERGRRSQSGLISDLALGIDYGFGKSFSAGLESRVAIPITSKARWDGALLASVTWWF